MLINFYGQLSYLLICLVTLRFDLVDMLNFALPSLQQVDIESVDFLKVLLQVAVLQK